MQVETNKRRKETKVVLGDSVHILFFLGAYITHDAVWDLCFIPVTGPPLEPLATSRHEEEAGLTAVPFDKRQQTCATFFFFFNMPNSKSTLTCKQKSVEFPLNVGQQ